METVHVDAESCDLYSPALLELFGSRGGPPDAGASTSAPAQLRLFGVPSKHIDKDAVLAAIDGGSACPLLKLKDLGEDHYVRRACGGRPCTGVFTTAAVPKWGVLGIFTGKWRTEDEHNLLDAHVQSKHLYEFRNVPCAKPARTGTRKRRYEGAPAHQNPVYCYVDASDAGNVTRELNHYKDRDATVPGEPNARFVEVLDGRTRLPHVIVLALRPIPAGAEATIDYGADYNFEDFQEKEEWRELEQRLAETEGRLKEALADKLKVEQRLQRALAGKARAETTTALLLARRDVRRASLALDAHDEGERRAPRPRDVVHGPHPVHGVIGVTWDTAETELSPAFLMRSAAWEEECRSPAAAGRRPAAGAARGGGAAPGEPAGASKDAGSHAGQRGE